jgi:plastocyanin
MKISRAILVASMLAAVAAGAALGAMAAIGGSSAARVTVTEVEYKLTLSSTHLAAGKTTLVVMNKGKLAHSLEISGPGLKKRLIAGTLMPGSSRSVTVTLEAGTYSLWCPIDSHAKLGMKTTFKAGSASSSGSTTTNKSSWG